MHRPIRSLSLAVAVFHAIGASGADGNFLNVAILALPDRYVADIPQKQRLTLLLRLSEQSSDRRLDYVHGWLHYYSDSEEPPRGSSMLYIKLLPRKDDTPLVFVHMPKPFADGSAPQKNQTFVLERAGDKWRDVTKQIIPEQIDLLMHFSPRRSQAIIEVAAYERRERNDHRGKAYFFGQRTLDLFWNGSSFEIRKPDSPTLSDNDT